MTYDLLRLKNNIDKEINISLTHSFDEDYIKDTDLIELNDVNINGRIYKNALGDIELELRVEGVMILPCAITLEPVDYPFFIDIEGEINEIREEFEIFSENYENTLDILPIIWENILMEIPMKVVSPTAKDIKLKGDGWALITDEDEVSSPLSELGNLLDEQ